jgi:HTH-type transcriptional regulator/antitoxin HigA
MSKGAEFQVDHPGVFIKDELEARGWDQNDLAFIVGTSPQQLNKILSGSGGITIQWAQLFGEAFDVNPQFFINLQAMYDLQHAARPDAGVKIRAYWLSIFPVREMIKRGWIEETEADLLDLQMMRFFRVNNREELQNHEAFAHFALSPLPCVGGAFEAA